MKSLGEALEAAVKKQGKPAEEIKSLNLDCTCRAAAVEVRRVFSVAGGGRGLLAGSNWLLPARACKDAGCIPG